jgi:hypothetical protein
LREAAADLCEAECHGTYERAAERPGEQAPRPGDCERSTGQPQNAGADNGVYEKGDE